jgi:ribonuclease I
MCYKNEFCEKLDNKHVDWTIHGLWPNVQGKTDFSDCTSERLDYDKFDEQTKSDIKRFWPTLTAKNSDFVFHSHEWTKHGTCLNACKYGIEKTDAQSFYFRKTLELREKYDPAKFFKRNEGYTVDEIRKIFKENIGADVVLVCNKNKEDKKENLVEIRLALDLENFIPFTTYHKGFYSSRCNQKQKIQL